MAVSRARQVASFLSGGVSANSQLDTNQELATAITTQESRVDLINTNLTSTNTAIRSIFSGYLQVANSSSIGGVNSVAFSAANNNLRISTADGVTHDVQIDVSDKATWSALTATNTAIRTLVSDRVQVANADSKYATWSALTTSNTSIRSYVDSEVAGLVDSAPETLNTLNELAAALGDDANFATTTATNIGQKLGATASITLTGDVSGSGSFSANAVSISTTIADDSHNHVISNIDNLQTSLDSKVDTTSVAVQVQLRDGSNNRIPIYSSGVLNVTNRAGSDVGVDLSL